MKKIQVYVDESGFTDRPEHAKRSLNDVVAAIVSTSESFEDEVKKELEKIGGKKITPTQWHASRLRHDFKNQAWEYIHNLLKANLDWCAVVVYSDERINPYNRDAAYYDHLVLVLKELINHYAAQNDVESMNIYIASRVYGGEEKEQQLLLYSCKQIQAILESRLREYYYLRHTSNLSFFAKKVKLRIVSPRKKSGDLVSGIVMADFLANTYCRFSCEQEKQMVDKLSQEGKIIFSCNYREYLGKQLVDISALIEKAPNLDALFYLREMGVTQQHPSLKSLYKRVITGMQSNFQEWELQSIVGRADFYTKKIRNLEQGQAYYKDILAIVGKADAHGPIVQKYTFLARKGLVTNYNHQGDISMALQIQKEVEDAGLISQLIRDLSLIDEIFAYRNSCAVTRANEYNFDIALEENSAGITYYESLLRVLNETNFSRQPIVAPRLGEYYGNRGHLLYLKNKASGDFAEAKKYLEKALKHLKPSEQYIVRSFLCHIAIEREDFRFAWEHLGFLTRYSGKFPRDLVHAASNNPFNLLLVQKLALKSKNHNMQDSLAGLYEKLEISSTDYPVNSVLRYFAFLFAHILLHRNEDERHKHKLEDYRQKCSECFEQAIAIEMENSARLTILVMSLATGIKYLATLTLLAPAKTYTLSSRDEALLEKLKNILLVSQESSLKLDLQAMAEIIKEWCNTRTITKDRALNILAMKLNPYD